MGDWVRTGRALACAATATPWIKAAALLVALVASAAVAAQPRDVTTVAPFSGTLQKIFERGLMRIGHRENSPPFAFLDAQRRPIGYSLDICEVVVEEVAQHLRKSIQVQYVPVTPANRFEMVRDGSVDLECGSTTASAQRRQLVDFSPTIFVTGTKLLVRARQRHPLAARPAGQDGGADERHHSSRRDTEDRRSGRSSRSVSSSPRDHDQSVQALAAGKADAFANDDVQLYGTIASRGAASDYRVVGDFLTYADYALMFRRDDAEFAEVVRQAFDRMASSGEILAIYRKWFQRPLPSGASLDLPMSAHLEHVFRLQGLAAD